MTEENDEDLKQQLEKVKKDIDKIEAKINIFNIKKNELLESKELLKDKIRLSRSLKLSETDWAHQKFSWSSKMEESLNQVFKLKSFRPQQLKTMNAIMSKQNVLLLAPTGGGKSLCFQLPSVISDGLTVVISPLISLMEDQVWSMKKLGVQAELLCSTTDKVTVNAILKMLCSDCSSLKLLYVTPERLAKSKRFMSALQKCYIAHKLDRIAIDEVHCCSQWGHDFRPDYKYLGNLKNMFPDVPILGVTATATTKVIIDVQKMLNIQDSVVLRAPFNRPNLYYHVLNKPGDKEDTNNLLADLLETRYKNECGIIYTFSIKDADDIALGLITRGIKVRAYHANLEPGRRTKIHSNWLDGRLQAVVATVAFGMGIDKPNVRFVIHHTLSKSIENFYQESGRAGRDGERAECVLLYRFSDIFRVSTMMFTEYTGLKNAYSMIEYCIDSSKCRRSLISSHFAEVWNSLDCDNMCDRCLNPDRISPTKMDITPYYKELLNIIDHANLMDVKLTGLKLIEAWYHKGPRNLRAPNSHPPTLNRTFAENIISFLIIKNYLKEDFHFTAFATNSYIIRGPLYSENKKIEFFIAKVNNLPIDKIYSNDIEFVSEEIIPKRHKKKKSKSRTRRSNESNLDETVTSSSTTNARKKRKINDNESVDLNQSLECDGNEISLVVSSPTPSRLSDFTTEALDIPSTSSNLINLSMNKRLGNLVTQLIEKEINLRNTAEQDSINSDDDHDHSKNNVNDTETNEIELLKEEKPESINDVILVPDVKVIIEIDDDDDDDDDDNNKKERF